VGGIEKIEPSDSRLHLCSNAITVKERMGINEEVRQKLLAMVEEDRAVRDALAEEGSLFGGYHPEMEAVHNRNASRLAAIVEQHGWPGLGTAGDDGAEAAWIIVQHAIGDPSFQRRGLELIKDAVSGKEAPPWQIAYLEDRIRSLEGRRQIYGTQYDWNEQGEMSPFPDIEAPERVDERRQAIGLVPLAENTLRMREGIVQTKERPPEDLQKRRAEMDEWAKSVGWRR